MLKNVKTLSIIVKDVYRLARLASRDPDARVIMSGGFLSPLLFFVQCRSRGVTNTTPRQQRIVREKTQPKCPLCGCNESSVDDMVWQCHARYNLVSWNLPSKPQCPLANRLCWPLGNEVDSDRALVRLFCQMRLVCIIVGLLQNDLMLTFASDDLFRNSCSRLVVTPCRRW